MTGKTPKPTIQWVMQVASVVILFSMLLAACGPAATATNAPAATDVPAAEVPTVASAATTAPAAEAPTTAPAAKYKEAPMLAKLSSSGALPAVEDRLPKNPRVLPVFEKIGTYGGTWHRAYSGIGDRNGLRKLEEEFIVEWYPTSPDKVDFVANWCDDYQVSPDAKVYTFHIREGLKWSDGVPVTTEDVKFWYEDYYSNTDLNPSPLMRGDKPVEVEIKDQFTFSVKLAASDPLFLSQLASNSSGDRGLLRPGFIQPAHYLKNFLPKYASQADLDKVVADKKVKSWTDLWGDMGAIQSEWLNPDMPTLAAWVVKVPPPAEQVVFERNPYYFAVDPEGNQLPYIDKLTFDLYQDQQTVDLWVTQGKIDEQARHLNASSLPLYKQSEEQGNYHINIWRSTQMFVLLPNLNVEDATLNKLFNDANFRQALNISINRDEVQQIAWNGFGKPRQASPIPGTPYYDADFSSKWTQFDPAAANKLLDDLGLTKKDKDGYRLREDGKRLTITALSDADTPCSFCELVQKYWKDVGIDFQLKSVARSMFDEMQQNGKQDMLAWWWDRNNIIEADPSNYLGTDGLWAPKWGLWYTSGGAKGQEPPQDHPIRQIWEAYKKATSTSDPAEARKAIQEIISIHKENVWVIGLVGEEPVPYVVSNHMHNVPDNFVQDEAFREEGFSQPAQFYLDNGQ